MIYRSQNLKGFTIIELMVVIVIIGIISLLAITVAFEARKSSRDTVRVNEISELKLAFRLYKEAYGSYPDYENGIRIGVGEAIDTDLEPFAANLDGDPLSNSSGGNYAYWYYSDFECDGTNHNVLFVQTLEFPDKNSNFLNEDSGCVSSGDSAYSSWMDTSYILFIN